MRLTTGKRMRLPGMEPPWSVTISAADGRVYRCRDAAEPGGEPMECGVPLHVDNAEWFFRDDWEDIDAPPPTFDEAIGIMRELVRSGWRARMKAEEFLLRVDARKEKP